VHGHTLPRDDARDDRAAVAMADQDDVAQAFCLDHRDQVIDVGVEVN
jgi:hypothetical protein